MMDIKINNQLYKIKEQNSLTILQACDLVNIHIPRFCYHEKLAIAGNCRMCFVEIPKSKKPVLACSTLISNEMSIYTNTYMVKKAQESALEFLLANHPLDCPICDQGGECDLQELTKNYGNDKGRFYEVKRSVEDLQLGNTIKTIMTRCIHCTRCIRFSKEILNQPILGTSGRGKDTEVSLYIDRIMHSELSGNLIDLCPVGALTSKPYAFTARPWELNHTESIDILDSFGSSIRIDSKGDEVMRILPKLNDDLNEEWITDKIRFTYDSFRLQRYTMPSALIITWSTNKNSIYLNSSWQYLFNLFIKYFIMFNQKETIFNVGNLIDLESSFYFKKLSNILSSKIKNYYFKQNIDFRNYYLLNDFQIENHLYYLIIGSNLNFENAMLNFKIQKNKSKKLINYVGYKWSNMINQISLTNLFCFKLLQGSHFDCFNLFNLNLIKILIKETSIYFIINKIRTFLFVLKQKYSFFYLHHIAGFIHSHFNTIHISEIGMKSSNSIINKFINNTTILQNAICFDLSTHINLNQPNNLINNALEKNGISFFIFQGHHKSILNNNTYNLILPNNLFSEENDYYFNNFGMLLYTNKAINRPGLSKSNKEILNKLIELFNLIKNGYSSFNLGINQFKSYFKTFEAFNDLKIAIPFKSFFFFHSSDLITINSPLMIKLIKEKKTLTNNFQETWV